jgi:photosystem II stability/assembly factor-like uncharacterized protein
MMGMSLFSRLFVFGLVLLVQSVSAFYTISIDGSGKFQVTAKTITGDHNRTIPAKILLSSDYGATWQETVVNGVYPSEYTSWKLTAVKMNPTGQYIVGSTSYGVIHSSDYGQTWQNASTGSPAEFISFASDPSGKTFIGVYAVCCNTQNGSLWKSEDYGHTWTKIILNDPTITDPKQQARYFYNADVDATGQIIVGAQESYFWISKDGGNNWKATKLSLVNHVTIDATGQYLAATSSLSDGSFYASSDGGETWTKVAGPIPSNPWYTSLTSSASGKYLAATCGYSTSYNTYPNYIVYSNDYGNTWSISRSPKAEWELVVANDDGDYFAAIGPSDFYPYYTQLGFLGAERWMVYGSPSAISVNGWTGAAMSKKGEHLYIVNPDGDIFQSSDKGRSFWSHHIDGAKGSWGGVATNDKGDLVLVFDGSYGGVVYVSRDAAETWTLAKIDSKLILKSVAFDATGQYGVAVSKTSSSDSTGFLYLSNDFGMTWNKVDQPLNDWRRVASDVTGQYLAATSMDVVNGGLHLSDDGGKTWYLQKVWTDIYTYPKISRVYSVVSSSDGQSLMVFGYYAPYPNSYYVLFYSKDRGLTWHSSAQLTNSIGSSLSASANDLQYAYAGNANNGYVHHSEDYGDHWASLGNYFNYLEEWGPTATDETGQYAVIGCKEIQGNFKISWDYGNTWTTRP